MINQGNNLISTIYRNSHLISLIALGNEIIFQSSPDFDSDTILFSMGVTSDLHFAYSYDSASNIENKIKKFAQLVNCLNIKSNNTLNFMAACGDYTSSGCYPQAVTFASAVSKTFAAINANRETYNKLKFAFCYGNHDTAWTGQMPISKSSTNYETLRAQSKKTITLQNVSSDRNFNLYEEFCKYFNINERGNLQAIPGSVVITPVDSYGEALGPDAIDNGNGTISIDTRPAGHSYYATFIVDYETGSITPIDMHSSYALSNITFSYYTSSYYNTWEDVLDTHGSFFSTTDNIPAELQGEGVYLWKEPIAENKYISIIGLETDNYAPNTYTNKVLTWLDGYLASLDSTLPCFILSHAPIMESKVFGADPELEANANWAATDNGVLDNILKKYSNVYYFSGHTHYLPILESNVMSNNYTAFNVGGLAGTLFSSHADVLDAANTDDRTGYASALYVEVDGDYNIRVSRLLMPNTSNQTTGTFTSSQVDNPNAGEATTYPLINQVITNSITLGTTDTSASLGTRWGMPVSDLITYSQDRGTDNQIIFSNPEFVIENIPVVGKDIQLSYQFNTASSTLPINCYKLILEDQKNNNNTLLTKWMTGNWNKVSTGVITGNSHLDATRLGYTVNSVLNNNSAVIAKLEALDIFGNKVELYPTQDCILCTSNAPTGLFNAIGNTCGADLRTTGTTEYIIHLSNLKQRYSSNFKIEFDLTTFGGAASNVRMSLSPGKTGTLTHRLMFQDWTWYTNPNGAYTNHGSSGFNLRHQTGSTLWTEESPFTMHCVFTFENGVAKLTTDKTSTILEYDIKSTYGDEYNNFVVDPTIIVRTAYFGLSNIVITNLD